MYFRRGPIYKSISVVVGALLLWQGVVWADPDIVRRNDLQPRTLFSDTAGGGSFRSVSGAILLSKLSRIENGARDRNLARMERTIPGLLNEIREMFPAISENPELSGGCADGELCVDLGDYRIRYYDPSVPGSQYFGEGWELVSDSRSSGSDPLNGARYLARQLLRQSDRDNTGGYILNGDKERLRSEFEKRVSVIPLRDGLEGRLRTLISRASKRFSGEVVSDPDIAAGIREAFVKAEKADIKEFNALVDDSGGLFQPEGWVLGFNTLYEAEDALSEFLVESYPGTLGLASEVLDLLPAEEYDMILEEYIFHEIVCPILGHRQARKMQEDLYSFNYEGTVGKKISGRAEGELGLVLRWVLAANSSMPDVEDIDRAAIGADLDELRNMNFLGNDDAIRSSEIFRNYGIYLIRQGASWKGPRDRVLKSYKSLNREYRYVTAKVAWIWNMEGLWSEHRDIFSDLKSGKIDRAMYDLHKKELLKKILEAHREFLEEYPDGWMIASDPGVRELQRPSNILDGGKGMPAGTEIVPGTGTKVDVSDKGATGDAMRGKDDARYIPSERMRIPRQDIASGKTIPEREAEEDRGTPVAKLPSGLTLRQRIMGYDWKGLVVMLSVSLVLAGVLWAVLPVNWVTVTLGAVVPILIMTYLIAADFSWSRIAGVIILSAVLSYVLPVPWLGLSMAIIIMSRMALRGNRKGIKSPVKEPGPPRSAEVEEKAAGNNKKKGAGRGRLVGGDEKVDIRLRGMQITQDILFPMMRIIELDFGNSSREKNAGAAKEEVSPEGKKELILDSRAVLDALFRFDGSADIVVPEPLRKELRVIVKEILKSMEISYQREFRILNDREFEDEEEVSDALNKVVEEAVMRLGSRSTGTRAGQESLAVNELVLEYFGIDPRRRTQLILRMKLKAQREIVKEIRMVGKKEPKNLYLLGRLEFYHGNYDQAEIAFSEAYDMARERGRQEGLSRYLFALGITRHVLAGEGHAEWEGATEAYNRALESKSLETINTREAERYRAILLDKLMDKAAQKITLEGKKTGRGRGATILPLKKLLAPDMSYADYSVTVGPYIEETVFSVLPFTIMLSLMTVSSFGVMALLSVMAASMAIFVLLHLFGAGYPMEMGLLRGADSLLRAPLLTAIFDISVASGLGAGFDLVLESALSKPAVFGVIGILTTLSFLSGRAFHSGVNRYALRSGKILPASLPGPKRGREHISSGQYPLVVKDLAALGIDVGDIPTGAELIRAIARRAVDLKAVKIDADQIPFMSTLELVDILARPPIGNVALSGKSRAERSLRVMRERLFANGIEELTMAAGISELGKISTPLRERAPGVLGKVWKGISFGAGKKAEARNKEARDRKEARDEMRFVAMREAYYRQRLTASPVETVPRSFNEAEKRFMAAVFLADLLHDPDTDPKLRDQLEKSIIVALCIEAPGEDVQGPMFRNREVDAFLERTVGYNDKVFLGFYRILRRVSTEGISPAVYLAGSIKTIDQIIERRGFKGRFVKAINNRRYLLASRSERAVEGYELLKGIYASAVSLVDPEIISLMRSVWNFTILSASVEDMEGRMGKRVKVVKVDPAGGQRKAAVKIDGKSGRRYLTLDYHGVLSEDDAGDVRARVTSDRYGSIIGHILKIATNDSPLIYNFDEIIEDMRGFAYPQQGIIALHSSLKDDPVALFHESAEYLANYRDGTRKRPLLRLVMGEHRGRHIISVRTRSQVDDKYSEYAVIELSDATLNFIEKEDWETGWERSQHYLLRVLQYECFGVSDEQLTAGIRGSSGSRMGAEVDRYEPDPLTGSQESFPGMDDTGEDKRADVDVAYAVTVDISGKIGGLEKAQEYLFTGADRLPVDPDRLRNIMLTVAEKYGDIVGDDPIVKFYNLMLSIEDFSLAFGNMLFDSGLLISNDQKENAAMFVEELLKNAFVHGNNLDLSETVTLRWEIGGGRLRFRVEDCNLPGKASEEDLSKAKVAGLHGSHFGVQLMRYHGEMHIPEGPLDGSTRVCSASFPVGQDAERAGPGLMDERSYVERIPRGNGDTFPLTVSLQDSVPAKAGDIMTGNREQLDIKGLMRRTSELAVPPDHRKALLKAFALLEQSPPGLVVYRDLEGDAFCFAYPENDVIGLYSGVAGNDSALAHGVLDYLVKRGDIELSFRPSYFTNLMWTLGFYNILVRTPLSRVMKGSLRLVYVKSGEIDHIMLKGSALSIAMRSLVRDGYRDQYLIRAITRSVFREKDKLMAEKIKLYQSMERTGLSPVEYTMLKEQGYRVYGVDSLPEISGELADLTGKGYLAVSPGVYGPASDGGLSMEFARKVKAETANVIYRIKETGRDNIRILVIGTGSGSDLLTAYFEASKAGISDIEILGLDISGKAIENTRINLELRGEEITADLRLREVAQGNEFSEVEGYFDLILFNAPNSVAYEPAPVRVGSSTHMDDRVFRNIMRNISSHITGEGAAVIDNVTEILDPSRRLIPSGLSGGISSSYGGLIAGNERRITFVFRRSGKSPGPEGEVRPLAAGDYDAVFNNLMGQFLGDTAFSALAFYLKNVYAESIVDNDDVYTLVYEEDGRVLGAIFAYSRTDPIAYLRGEELHVSFVAVDKADRGRGIGRLLFDKMIEKGLKEGYKWISVRPVDPSMSAIVRDRGFHKQGKVYYLNGAPLSGNWHPATPFVERMTGKMMPVINWIIPKFIVAGVFMLFMSAYLVGMSYLAPFALEYFTGIIKDPRIYVMVAAVMAAATTTFMQRVTGYRGQERNAAGGSLSLEKIKDKVNDILAEVKVREQRYDPFVFFSVKAKEMVRALKGGQELYAFLYFMILLLQIRVPSISHESDGSGGIKAAVIRYGGWTLAQPLAVTGMLLVVSGVLLPDWAILLFFVPFVADLCTSMISGKTFVRHEWLHAYQYKLIEMARRTGRIESSGDFIGRHMMGLEEIGSYDGKTLSEDDLALIRESTERLIREDGREETPEITRRTEPSDLEVISEMSMKVYGPAGAAKVKDLEDHLRGVSRPDGLKIYSRVISSNGTPWGYIIASEFEVEGKNGVFVEQLAIQDIFSEEGLELELLRGLIGEVRDNGTENILIGEKHPYFDRIKKVFGFEPSMAGGVYFIGEDIAGRSLASEEEIDVPGSEERPEDVLLRNVRSKILSGQEVNIAFACVVNAERSFIMEMIASQIARDRGLDNVNITSFGTGAVPGVLAASGTLRAAAEEKGVDSDLLEGFRPARPDRESVDSADIIIAASKSVSDYLGQLYPGSGNRLVLFADIAPEAVSSLRSRIPERGIGEQTDYLPDMSHLKGYMAPGDYFDVLKGVVEEHLFGIDTGTHRARVRMNREREINTMVNALMAVAENNGSPVLAIDTELVDEKNMISQIEVLVDSISDIDGNNSDLGYFLASLEIISGKGQSLADKIKNITKDEKGRRAPEDVIVVTRMDNALRFDPDCTIAAVDVRGEGNDVMGSDEYYYLDIPGIILLAAAKHLGWPKARLRQIYRGIENVADPGSLSREELAGLFGSGLIPVKIIIPDAERMDQKQFRELMDEVRVMLARA